MNAPADLSVVEEVEDDDAVETAAPTEKVSKPKRRGGRRLLLMFGLPAVLIIGGGYFYLTGGRYQDTDNAYVRQTIVSLSSDVSGRIVEVDVGENEHVAKGQVLFRIDPEPYRIALAQADAALSNARLSVDQLRVSYKTAVAKLQTAKATLDIKKRSRDRVVSLTDKGLATDSANDTSLLDLEQAQSGVDLAQQAVDAAVAALGGNPDIATDDLPSVKAAIAAYDSAKRNFKKTTVVAPASGIVSQVGSLNIGQMISAGSTVASLVESDASWVEANFKETQLQHMKAGETVEIGIDSFGQSKLTGTVASIGAATGAEFSLIPPQNATGNWVKVVQRIPVRIDITDTKGLDLRSGMSATVSVDTGKTLLDRLM